MNTILCARIIACAVFARNDTMRIIKRSAVTKDKSLGFTLLMATSLNVNWMIGHQGDALNLESSDLYYINIKILNM